MPGNWHVGLHLAILVSIISKKSCCGPKVQKNPGTLEPGLVLNLNHTIGLLVYVLVMYRHRKYCSAV